MFHIHWRKFNILEIVQMIGRELIILDDLSFLIYEYRLINHGIIRSQKNWNVIQNQILKQGMFLKILPVFYSKNNKYFTSYIALVIIL